MYSDNAAYGVAESEYMYLSEDDVDMLTLKGLCYAKNEIYARYGRKFQSDELQRYFNSCTWYQGIYEPETYDDTICSMMNKYEQYNVTLLLKMEKRLGMYSLD